MKKTYNYSSQEIISFVITFYVREYNEQHVDVGDLENKFGCNQRYNYLGENYELPEINTLVRVHFTPNPKLSLCWFNGIDINGNYIVENIFDHKIQTLDKHKYAISGFNNLYRGLFNYWEYDDNHDYWHNK